MSPSSSAPQAFGRAPLPKDMVRTVRLQVTVTERDKRDLDAIGKAWDVPASTALYYLSVGRLSELRGEDLSLAGGDLVSKVGAWLGERLPTEEKEAEADGAGG